MNFKKLAVAAAAVLAMPAFAAIAPGNVQSGGNVFYNGNGELFLAVFDSNAKVSYAFDLGVTMNTFFVDAQKDAGFTAKWTLNDANWNSFLGVSGLNRANLRWLVNAFDIVGGTAVGQLRWFTTVEQGTESGMSTMTNQLFQNGVGAPQAGTFFNSVNNTGTHVVNGSAINFAANGSSVNFDSDSGNSYVGDGSVGLSTTLNGNARDFNTGNAVGTASDFFYVTRSGGNQLASVLVDPFNNAAGRGTFALNATGVGNTYELTYALAPIPEPGTLAMLLAGGAVLAGVARRNRRQA